MLAADAMVELVSYSLSRESTSGDALTYQCTTGQRGALLGGAGVLLCESRAGSQQMGVTHIHEQACQSVPTVPRLGSATQLVGYYVVQSRF